MTVDLSEFNALVEYGEPGAVAEYVAALLTERAALRQERDEAREDHFRVNQERLTLEASLATLRAELENIANANPSTWEEDVRDQFQQWAQNRARLAIAKVEGK